jgi:hypothetical protein
MMKKGVIFGLLLIILSGPVYALQLAEPTFGVSPAGTFNVTVVAGSTVNCRYAGIKLPFSEMFHFDLSKNSNTTYKKIDFSLGEGTVYDFYVNCTNMLNPTLVIEASKFELSIDLTDPQLTEAKADPAEIADTPLQTTLSVKTNERTFCKYGTSMVWDEMSAFAGVETDVNAYRLNNSKQLSLEDNKLYNFAFECRDLANRSAATNVTVLVNTSLPAAITDLKPETNSYFASTKINLTVWTNKKSVCWYGNTSATEQGGDYSTEGKNHSVQLELPEGQHTYYVKCRFADLQELSVSTTFTLDLSAPTKPEINDSSYVGKEPQYTYYTDRLHYVFESEDNESGISLYNYSIWSLNRMVLNWTITTDSSGWAENLRLENGKKYYFKAKAQNNAGLWSQEAQSSGVTVDTSLTPDPCETKCGGDCPPCEAGESCTKNADCKSRICKNNKCVAPSCFDKVLNGNETDTDCGGSCSGCAEGKGCSFKADCASGFVCSNNKCSKAAHCLNSEQDVDETDVDCGGLECEKCAKGKKCLVDEDCSSGKCYANKCVTKGDIDDDGVKDTEDNCFATNNPEQEDMDGDGLGDACDDDADGDALLDSWEKSYFGGIEKYSSNDDNDEDGLTNKEEFVKGTNPVKADTDGDGYTDKEEIDKGYDPNNANSHPAKFNYFLMILLMVVVAALAVLLYKKLQKPKLPKTEKPGTSVATETKKAPQEAQLKTPKFAEPSKRRAQRKRFMEEFEEKEPTGDEVFEKLKEAKEHFRRESS